MNKTCMIGAIALAVSAAACQEVPENTTNEPVAEQTMEAPEQGEAE